MTAPPWDRADVCVAACAEAFRGDGEVLASPMGVVSRLGAMLAKATFEPDLLLADRDATLLGEVTEIGQESRGVVEGWMPYRAVLDLVAHGRRHVMMGASQIDQYGNQNISAIGDWTTPDVMLVGVRGGPGNTVNHRTSYWIPNHSRRTFVDEVDLVGGVGNDRARGAGSSANRYHDLRRVVTQLGVMDFETDDGRMRLRSLHPGVSLDDVVEATSFELVIDQDPVPTTPGPDAQALHLLTSVLDPQGTRYSEVSLESASSLRATKERLDG